MHNLRSGCKPAIAAFWAAGIAASLALAAAAHADDWIFDHSYYTNDPKTGQRVDQYQAIKPVRRIPLLEFFSVDGPHPWGMYPFGPFPYYGFYPGDSYLGFGPALGPYPFYGPLGWSEF
jgi:hypothetical protein